MTESITPIIQATACVVPFGSCPEDVTMRDLGAAITIVIFAANRFYGCFKDFLKFLVDAVWFVLKPGAEIWLKQRWEEFLKPFLQKQDEQDEQKEQKEQKEQDELEALEVLRFKALGTIKNSSANWAVFSTMPLEDRQVQEDLWLEHLRLEKTPEGIRNCMKFFAENFYPDDRIAWKYRNCY